MKTSNNLVTLLRKLDSKLQDEECLIICGGMAVALAFGGKRATIDIDVIAPVPLSDPLRAAVKNVAKETGADPDWLNDSAKGFASYLPVGWEKRLVSVALGLKKIKLMSLGKPDLIMMKLKAARERDITDIKTLSIDQNDIQIIRKNLERIDRFDKKTTLFIKLLLEEWGYHV
ncbi:MAG: hypothetical protein ACD_62C00649G0001 [uncultured bacterium]|nr:MAG: hypothetical protein ACD_62C00649G0001 [uncultured bacterium]